MSSVPRFFIPPAIADGDTVILPPEPAHHARSVLRLRVGEAILLHTGNSNALRCVLTDVSPQRVAARVAERLTLTSEPRTRITVAQALPKTPDKIEQVFQHGTEVGAAGFAVWSAHRSVARLGESDKKEKRLARWHGIVQGAAEQSGRGVNPTVAWRDSATELSRTFGEYDAVIVLHESAALPLREALDRTTDSASFLVVVGPEGGLTDSEVAEFTSAGGAVVSLGSRVLRTETAALVALAQILYAREE